LYVQSYVGARYFYIREYKPLERVGEGVDDQKFMGSDQGCQGLPETRT